MESKRIPAFIKTQEEFNRDYPILINNELIVNKDNKSYVVKIADDHGRILFNYYEV